jgi:hypothetical protein
MARLLLTTMTISFVIQAIATVFESDAAICSFLADNGPSLSTPDISALLEVVERPGRGIALSGVKAFYERTPNVSYYESTRNHHDPAIFYLICGESPEAFDALLLECRAAIEQPFKCDAHAIHANTAVELRPRVRARSLRTEEMLLCETRTRVPNV